MPTAYEYTGYKPGSDGNYNVFNNCVNPDVCIGGWGSFVDQMNYSDLSKYYNTKPSGDCHNVTNIDTVLGFLNSSIPDSGLYTTNNNKNDDSGGVLSSSKPSLTPVLRVWHDAQCQGTNAAFNYKNPASNKQAHNEMLYWWQYARVNDSYDYYKVDKISSLCIRKGWTVNLLGDNQAYIDSVIGPKCVSFNKMPNSGNLNDKIKQFEIYQTSTGSYYRALDSEPQLLSEDIEAQAAELEMDDEVDADCCAELLEVAAGDAFEAAAGAGEA